MERRGLFARGWTYAIEQRLRRFGVADFEHKQLRVSAPFIVVNMAAGVTPMRVLDFVAGTALGIVPKIALTAFAGNSIARAMRGDYLQTLAEFQEFYREECARANIDYLPMDTSVSFDKALMEYLLQRQKRF